MRKRLVVVSFCAFGIALAGGLTERWARAQTPDCDFTTGGGYIFPDGSSNAKGTFGVAGGCKHGSGLGDPPGPYWGHLQYHDHGLNLKVKGTSTTGYGRDLSDPKVRFTCGTAETNFGDVEFIVRTKDGTNDEFDIQLVGAVEYSTFMGEPHRLGGGVRGGGSINLHKPNDSNTGVFSVDCPPPPEPPQGSDVSVTKSTTTAQVNAGDPISFDIVVHNAGPAAATDVTVFDNLPTGPGGTVTWTDNQADCQITSPTPDTQVLTCMFVESLEAGANITIHVDADPAATECRAEADPEPTFSNQAQVAASNETPGTQEDNISNVSTIRANCIEF